MRRGKATLLILALAAVLTALPASAATTNDPLINYQWGLDAIDVYEAWNYNYGGSNEVRVAVIDGGVAYDIPDFAQTNFDLAAGWDYVDNDADAHSEGDEDHGTHVAATIAQSSNNATGTAGIAFNATIIPIRVIDTNGAATLDNLIAGIDRAIAVGADIINLSLGGSGSILAEFQAIERAYRAGILVVAAAGNSTLFAGMSDFPAFYGSTVAVGALDSDLSSAFYSSPAIDADGYGLVAPGTDILQVTEFGEQWYSGTSMASPHVAGVAALVLAEAMANGKLPDKNSQRVDWLTDLLYATAEDLGRPGPDYVYGYGLVQADDALRALQ